MNNPQPTSCLDRTAYPFARVAVYMLSALSMGTVPAHAVAEPPAAAPVAPAPTEVAPLADAYYLSTCAMCDGLLGAKGEAARAVYAGREVRFCSSPCRARYESDPAQGAARLDRVMIADQRPLYPLGTSVVSGKDLGDAPTEFIWGNRLFRVANAHERAQVEADPRAYFKALDRAVIEAQTPTYGMPSKCPVQGDILESDTAIDIVVANRMVRVCCTRCARVVRARPSQYLSMVDYANRAAREHRPKERPD